LLVVAGAEGEHARRRQRFGSRLRRDVVAGARQEIAQNPSSLLDPALLQPVSSAGFSQLVRAHEL
jgi:hypothetical protein